MKLTIIKRQLKKNVFFIRLVLNNYSGAKLRNKIVFFIHYYILFILRVFFLKKYWDLLADSKISRNFASLLKTSTPKKSFGEMAEWSIAAVLKTVVLRGTGGSNPSLSAQNP